MTDAATKTPAEIEREKINVTTSKGTESEETKPEKVEAKEPEGTTEENEKETGTETEETVDAKTTDVEKENEADDDKQSAEDKERRKQERIDRRIAKLTAEKKAAEKAVADLQAKLQAQIDESGEKLSPEDVKKEAERLANEQLIQREFTAACNRLADNAKKESGLTQKAFDEKVNAMADEIGAIPTAIIGILDDLDNGASVLNHLMNNIDEAEEIWALNPAKMALRLAKISDKVAEAKKPKPKQISKVPDPVEAINGGNTSPQVLSDKMPMDQWMKLRNKQAQEHRKNKYG